jgi:O-antigen ligase
VDRSVLGRFEIWKVGFRALVANMPFGVGFGRYAVAQSRAMTHSLESFNPMNFEAKSEFLNLLVETGVLGLALAISWFGFVVEAWKRRFKTVSGNPDSAFLVCYTICAFVDTPVFQSHSLSQTALFCACLALVKRDAISIYIDQDSLVLARKSSILNIQIAV